MIPTRKKCKDKTCDSVGRTHSHKFPDECHWDNVDSLGKILLWVIDDEDREEDGTKVIEDPVERKQFTMKYAKEHNAEVYTEVDLDDGNIGYSRGFRFVNRINDGLYVVVKQ